MTTEYIAAGKFFRDQTIEVPLDWENPESSEKIDVFVRDVSRAQDWHRELPFLLFLQGGPGGKGPPLVGSGGWIDAALERYRVVLLDQRGTGGLTPISAATGSNAAKLRIAALRLESCIRLRICPSF